jgi:hypothetical protein
MSEAAHRLADHWREEAEKQAAINRAAGTAETLDKLSALEVGAHLVLAATSGHGKLQCFWMG